MGVNTFKRNHLMPLHFKGLNLYILCGFWCYMFVFSIHCIIYFAYLLIVIHLFLF